MGKKHRLSLQGIQYTDIDLFKCKFLGKGHNGIVYLLPDNRVIKICYIMKDFHGEAHILNKVSGNKYFPMLYEVGGNYMIRDYVDGVTLKNYIKTNGLSKELALEIIEMLKEFERLQFTKIDIRCKDVYVQPDGTLKIIDPQNFYSKSRDFPRHLSKGLYKLGVLKFFLEVLKEVSPKHFNRWSIRIRNYIAEKLLFDEL